MIDSDWAPLFQGLTGAILIAAGASKLLYRGDLKPILIAAGLRDSLARTLALTVPWAEIALGVLAVIGVLPVASAFAMLLVAAGFVTVLARANRRGFDQPCLCFGVQDDSHGLRLSQLRAQSFLALAITWFAFEISLPVDRLVIAESRWGDAIPVAGAVLAAAFIVGFTLLGKASPYLAQAQSMRASRKKRAAS